MSLPNKASLNDYGGILSDAVPVEDSTIEISADSLNACRNDVAAMTNTVPILIFQYAGASTNPVITSSSTWTAGVDSVWGNAPANNPTFVRNSAGVYTVTLPTSVNDSLGNSILVNIRAVSGTIISNPTPGHILCQVTSSTTFTIKQFTASGSANDLVGSLIFIQVY